MRRASWSVLVLAVALAACESPTVPSRDLAYDFRVMTADGERVVVRWPAGSAIRVYLAPSGDASRDASLVSAFGHGAVAWNDAALYGEYQLERASSPDRADVVVGWSDVELPVDTGGCPPGGGGRAVTTFCNSRDRRRLDVFPLRGGGGEVRMVVVVSGFEAGSPEAVRRLVAHELGHVIGIGTHSTDLDDLMAGGALRTDTPTEADRQTAQVLYHTAADILP